LFTAWRLWPATWITFSPQVWP